MELSVIIPHIEVLIFASEKPLTPLEIVELINNAFGFMEERVTLDQVESCIEGIREKYNAEFYPFELRESGGGWQFLTKKEYHKTLAQLNGDKFLKRLSNAALETLAIIAYKQPITKGEIEAIRGVNTDYSIQKLLEKELILISGRNDNLPGRPLIYATSKNFMDYFGINSADDLPKIKEVLADQVIEATMIKPEDFATSAANDVEGELATVAVREDINLTVSETGELIEIPVTAEEEEETEVHIQEEQEKEEHEAEEPTDEITHEHPASEHSSPEESDEKEENEKDKEEDDKH
ncbi:SMC-Scp complex subunit ScpB [Chitinophagaceae bacterium LWZ2-11]